MGARVANTLEEAGPRDLVHIDARGRVRSRAKARVLATLYWGTLTALVGVEAFLGHSLFGLPGLSIAAALGGYMGWVGTRLIYLRRGLELLTESKLDDADAFFQRVANARLVPRRLRARAWGGLAATASVRGDPETALAHLRESLRLQGKSRRAIGLAAKHSEIKLLARLGRIPEARELMALLPQGEPKGEYTLLSHYSTHLYVAFRDGKHDFDDGALHDMAAFALPITSAAPLLALLAWAFEKNGDADMRELLLDEALDRHPGDLLSMTMPNLQRWMDEAPRARAAEVDDGETVEELEVDAHGSRELRGDRVRR